MRFAISDRQFAISEKGFSLLELMMVLALSAIMIGMATMRLGGNREVRHAADMVASAMRLAHRKAITEEVDYYACYDTDGGIVWVQIANGADPDSADFGTKKTLPTGITVSQSGTQTYGFYKDGTADNDTVTLTMGTASFAVTIYPTTGLVTVK